MLGMSRTATVLWCLLAIILGVIGLILTSHGTISGWYF